MKFNNVAEILANHLKKYIKDVFMLTGYGAMYLNDALKQSGIRFYVSRNEAAAPMMAEAYSKAVSKLSAVCVTAGPGATNAIPGLAEAYVDSAPIIVLSGQVEKKFTSDNYKNYNIRSFGIAEFSITDAIKKFTKYSATINNPYNCIYELEKAIYFAQEGRKGPVWIEVPLDVQSFQIKDKKKLRKFIRPKKKKKKIQLNQFLNILNKSKKPIFIIGNGIKQSKSKNIFNQINNKLNIPFLCSRFAIDLFPFSKKNNMGQVGIKGQLYNEKILSNTDLIISLGCRLGPALTMKNKNFFSKKVKKIIVDVDKSSLKHPLVKFDYKLNENVADFLHELKNQLKKIKYQIDYEKIKWSKYCNYLKKNNPIDLIKNKNNPIDLYRFMYLLNKISKKGSIFTNDAGSNYYVGGQVWYFENKQMEICSSTNAAMGLSVPLSIGAAVASPKTQIISVTGDGSIELNIQELKTISHYNLNIKTFVINNGGYASMRNWQDNVFDGNRIDTKRLTGVGTLNFKNIAKAFNLNYFLIEKESLIEKSLKKIFTKKGPCLIEVVTNPNQKILGAEI
tara:strand:- start:2694 stop:4382 length:1689 start_codon:yes stop_codon:yes gene_type:complete